MTDTRREESQQELFREFSEERGGADGFTPIPKSQKPILLNTSLEQLILTGILSILALCLVFFLGVLRGNAFKASLSGSPQSTHRLTVAAPPTDQSLKPPILMPVPPKLSAALATAADPAKPYTISLVTYKKQAQAEQEANRLKKAGYPAYFSRNGGYFVVCVGRYANGAEAKKDLRFFDRKYKGCYLLTNA